MASDRKRLSRQELADIERQRRLDEAKKAKYNAVEGIKVLLMDEKFENAEKAIEDLFPGPNRKYIPGEFYLHLAQGYCRAKKWDDAERVLVQMEEFFPQFKMIPAAIVRAHISVENGRPRRAIRFLDSLDHLDLEHDYAQAYQEILHSAQQLILDGCVEID